MKLTSPIPGAPLSDGFGPRDPIHTPGGTSGAFHYGQDYAARANTPIRAAGPGVVIEARWIGTYGYAVYLDHGDGLVTRYAHMIAPPPVSAGWHIERGDTIGYVGSTGASTGPHLHFEVVLHGTRVNPLDYLTDSPKPESEADMAKLITTDEGNILVVDHNQMTYWNVHQGIPANLVDLRMTWLKNQGAIQEVHGLQPAALLSGYRNVGVPASAPKVGTVEVSAEDVAAIAAAVNDDAAKRMKS